MFAHNFEGVSVDELHLAAAVMLLAKGRNDPTLLHTLRTGALSLVQYQGERVR
jgi:hypothetical protein